MTFGFKHSSRLAVALLALSAATGQAAPGEVSSIYREINLKKQCAFQPERGDTEPGGWRCAGYRGMPVEIGAQDGRTRLSFGPRPWHEKAGRQTLSRPNKFAGGVIEWRLDGEGKAFAAITRWKAQRPSDKPFEPYSGSVLVVTRLGPGGVCHVGSVDARLNAQAETLAREIADRKARTFQCDKDSAVIAGNREPGFDIVTP